MDEKRILHNGVKKSNVSVVEIIRIVRSLQGYFPKHLSLMTNLYDSHTAISNKETFLVSICFIITRRMFPSYHIIHMHNDMFNMFNSCLLTIVYRWLFLVTIFLSQKFGSECFRRNVSSVPHAW